MSSSTLWICWPAPATKKKGILGELSLKGCASPGNFITVFALPSSLCCSAEDFSAKQSWLSSSTWVFVVSILLVLPKTLAITGEDRAGRQIKEYQWHSVLTFNRDSWFRGQVNQNNIFRPISDPHSTRLY